MPTPVMDRRAWWLFAAACVLWGIPYLFIAIAVDAGISPGFLACARTALGFAVLAPLAWRAGAFRGLRARWRALVAYTTVELVLPLPLIGWGEQRISSSLTAILIASLPLMVAVLVWRLQPSERVAGRRLVGLLIGFAGVVALLGLDVAGRPRELLGAGAVLLATVGYAAGPMIITRRLADLAPLGPVCASLGLAALLLTPLAAATAPTEVPTADGLVAVAVLGVACSAAAFIVFFALIARVGPSRAAVVTYLNPVVAVTLGILVLDERPGPAAVAGLLLVLAGSWLATGGGLPPTPRTRARRAAARRAASPA